MRVLFNDTSEANLAKSVFWNDKRAPFFFASVWSGTKLLESFDSSFDESTTGCVYEANDGGVISNCTPKWPIIELAHNWDR